MIRVERSDEPPQFDEQVRTPGRRWLSENNPQEKKRPPDHWRRVYSHLRTAFGQRCAYSAMQIQTGTIDHFISVHEACQTNRPELIYEWSNYRYADSSLNSSKQNMRSTHLLDPFEIEDDWFEVQIPSCQLLVTEHCPASHKKRAHHMIKRLRLNGEKMVDVRRSWLECYQDSPNMSWLERCAPMIARAVRKLQKNDSAS